MGHEKIAAGPQQPRSQVLRGERAGYVNNPHRLQSYPLVEQFLGGAQGLPTFLSRVEVSDPKKKKGLQPFIQWTFVGAAGD